MTTTYEAAVAELYRARLDVFVAERKRLATELKAAGDKAGAARLAKLVRPPISAWVVNQLWWQARPAFEELLRVAARLRDGDRAATVAHRELVARLRGRAGALLGEAGHAATEATLRRVTATLSAIAAAGTFDPDPAGALTSDRDPPGFDAMGLSGALASPGSSSGIAAGSSPPTPTQHAEVAREKIAEVVVLAEASERRRVQQERERAAAAEQAAAEQAAAEQAAAEQAAAEQAAAERAAAERSRIEAAERAARLAERERLDRELRSMKQQAEAQQLELERLRRQLSGAEEGLQRTQARLDELAARRAELDSKS